MESFASVVMFTSKLRLKETFGKNIQIYIGYTEHQIQ